MKNDSDFNKNILNMKLKEYFEKIQPSSELINETIRNTIDSKYNMDN